MEDNNKASRPSQNCFEPVAVAGVIGDEGDGEITARLIKSSS
jgi:hypothetical protein